MKTNSLQESGNAMWFILIAIALMGGLTVMLSRSTGTSEETGDYERTQLSATKIVREAKSYELAIDQLKARGCGENEISFWHDSDGNDTEDGSDDYYNARSPVDRSCHLFSPEGAGLNYGAGWIFTGESRVLGLGSDARTELLAVFETNIQNCMQMNNLAGVPNDASDAPSENFGQTEFTGTFGTTFTDPFTIGNTSVQFEEAFQSCSKDSADAYHYAHVLIQR